MNMNDDEFEALEGPFEQTPGTHEAVRPSGSSNLAVQLVPDDGMEGVVGGTIISNKYEGDKHFVSPKQSTEITNEYVVLKATGISEDDFANNYEWGGGEAVPEKPLKRRIKRGSADKNEITIKAKGSGTVIRKLIVWIVWVTGAKVGETPIATNVKDVATETPAGNPPKYFGPGIEISGRYNFKFTITPASIITDPDHPDFDVPNTYEKKTIDPPGGDLKHLFGGDLKKGANYKWDVSRRVKVKVLNPHLYKPGDLWSLLNGGTLWDNQPKAENEPATYPGDARVGNDDHSVTDERNNPYVAASDASKDENKTHAIGEIASTDAPTLLMRNTTGVDGEKFEIRFHFGEFVRLLIGNKWYRCSDWLDWRIHFKIKRQNGSWVDDASVMAVNNIGY